MPVCPTGARYKRAEDGIVLVDYDKCIGCKYLRVGVPVRRARARRGAPGDEQVHAVRRPHPRPALPEAERKPACVLACPTHARLFGDFNDPESEVSQHPAERGGFGLMPELGYKPVNHYLPPREPPQVGVGANDAQLAAGAATSPLTRLIDAARRFAQR